MKVVRLKYFIDKKIIKKAIAIYENHQNIFITFIKNGKPQSDKTYSFIIIDKSFHNTVSKHYCYFGLVYQNIKNDASWKKEVKKIKRVNRLKIFK